MHAERPVKNKEHYKRQLGQSTPLFIPLGVLVRGYCIFYSGRHSCLPERDFYMVGKSKDQGVLSKSLLNWMYWEIGFSPYVSKWKHQVSYQLLGYGDDIPFIHIDVAQYNCSVYMGQPWHDKFPYIAQVNSRVPVFVMVRWEFTCILVQILPKEAHSSIDV